MSATTSSLFQYSKCDPMLMPKILLLTRVIMESFQKKKEDSSCLPLVIFSLLWSWFTTLCHASSDKICTKDKNFSSTIVSPRFGAKSEIYYSSITIHLLLFMTLFTPNFCLFKGGCPLYFKQVFICLVQDFFPRESYPLRAFLWEISLLTITSLLSLQIL